MPGRIQTAPTPQLMTFSLSAVAKNGVTSLILRWNKVVSLLPDKIPVLASVATSKAEATDHWVVRMVLRQVKSYR